jgi:hypothetical protein
LFARKFDPQDPKSIELADYIDIMRQKSADELQHIYKLDYGGAVMIATRRPQIGNNENSTTSFAGDTRVTVENLNDLLCMEIMKSGHRIRLAKCEPSLPFQWFKIGPCTEGTDMYIKDGECASAVQNQESMFCQLTSMSKANPACVDILGENIETDSKLIAFDCTGNWNQLFRLNSDCTISVTQPEIVAYSKGSKKGANTTMCLNAQLAEKGFEVCTQACEGPENITSKSKFLFLRKDGKLVKNIKSSIFSEL